jgi:flagellar biosynthesis/type III secretory pathway protein FliH
MIVESVPQEGPEVLSDSEIWADSDDEVVNKGNNGQSVSNDDDDDDEFYGVKPDVPENSDIAALRRIHAKQGYLAGLSSQKEESLQKGFDEGYPVGADLGIQVGKILGCLQILSVHSNLEVSNKAKDLLKSAQNELGIKKVLNKRYFDDDMNIETHPLIIHWNEETQSLIQLIK